jgi:DNA-directed RNA polymerase specialized sigma24 family protein
VNKRREVANDEVVQALADPDVREMVEYETGKYRNGLDDQQRESIGQYAVWRALQYYKKEFGQKFTTSLYRFIHYECCRELKKVRRSGHLQRYGPDVSEMGLAHQEPEPRQVDPRLVRVAEMIDKFLPKRVAVVMRRHYLERQPLDEVAAEAGMSREAAGRAITWGVERMRELCDVND